MSILKIYMENPFKTIKKAKKEDLKRKISVSQEESGGPNARGQGGPVFDHMIENFNNPTNAKSAGKNVEALAAQFERTLVSRGSRLYNSLVFGHKGVPTSEVFNSEMDASFRKGFEYFLKVALRTTEQDAPKPYVANSSEQADPSDKNKYLKQYITHGKDIVAFLKRNPERHSFKPEETEAEAYKNKYQSVGVGEVDSALQAYMFEKLRIYSDQYFNMLEEGLRAGLSSKKAMNLAETVYSTDADYFHQMASSKLDVEFVYRQFLAHKTNVHLPFETYHSLGPTLEEEYPYSPGSGSWVTSPHHVRNLLFKYPKTAAQGMKTVNEHIAELRDTYPIRQSMLVDFCCKNPEHYRDEIEDFLEYGKSKMDLFPATQDDHHASNTPASNFFAHYSSEDSVFTFLSRTGKSKHDSQLKWVVDQFKKAQERAQKEKITLDFNTERKILRKLLSVNASISNILKREKRRKEERIAVEEKTFDRLWKKHDFWAHYIIDSGWGIDVNDVIASGESIVEMLRESLGDSEAQNHIDRCLDLYSNYANQNIAREKELALIKDAIFNDPYSTKSSYESLHNMPWPEKLEEFNLE